MIADEIYKVVQKMSVKTMNEKELIISKWLEMNGEKISSIINETYSFDDLKKKLEEYMILKDKATPEKPFHDAVGTEDGDEVEIRVCPNCSESVNFIVNFPYCPYCGQAIDWSDEE